MAKVVTRKDPLHILEAGYRFDSDEAAWTDGILRAAQPYDLGLGLAALVYDHQRSAVRHVAGRSPAEDTGRYVRRFVAAIPEQVARAVYAPSPLRYVYDTVSVACARAGIESSALAEMLDRHALPLWPTWGAIGGDASETFVLCLSCRQREDFDPRDRPALDAAAAHLGAALRLRALLRRAPSGDHAMTEAVLAPDGRLLDARAPAVQRSRATLADAVRRMDRARTRRATPEERVRLWTALLEGRWSIVESTERDGKRMILACRNEPRVLGMRKLTARQRSITSYAALGHTYKYISYELGISITVVATELRAAMRKLGIRNRGELISTFGGGENRVVT
ncbi:MAG TPA: helix-turn-helix transcriptional regulator [Polyangiaceae bacterium]